ncbi:MAG: methyltransferase domain-containing protein [Herpetosiphonaceae bacterium]|nr:methyltransferase domain-containing protein [Herpetosiphonaceae bacterium]
MTERLPNNYFQRYDDARDEQFYDAPRLVTHIDEKAIAAVTQLYREFFPPNGTILDLMSSWVSHLPPDVTYHKVVGLGMSQEELDANPRLDERIVQNLNTTPQLPFETASFDGAGICVSVQYLTQPITVFRELGRILKADAPLVVTFSNRCFPTKAVAIWQSLDDRGHGQLVSRYFQDAGKWRDIQVLDRSSRSRRNDPLYAVVGRSTG